MKERKKTKEARPPLSLFREPVTLFLGREDAVRAEGVKRILVCLDTEVSLRLRAGGLHVYGERLVCTTFSNGAVEITGRVTRVCIEGRERSSEDPLS